MALATNERQVAPEVAGIQTDHRERYLFAAERMGGRILDLGCGVGYGAAILADAPGITDVVAVDRSQESLAYAKSHYHRPKITWIGADLRVGAPEVTVDWAVALL